MCVLLRVEICLNGQNSYVVDISDSHWRAPLIRVYSQRRIHRMTAVPRSTPRRAAPGAGQGKHICGMTYATRRGTCSGDQAQAMLPRH